MVRGFIYAGIICSVILIVIEYNQFVRKKSNSGLKKLFPYLLFDIHKQYRKKKIAISQLNQKELEGYTFVVDNIEGEVSKETKLFRTISFTLTRGKAFGIVGHLNSGRDEFCRKITGYDKFYMGSVYVNGLSITSHLAQEKNMIAMAFNYSSIPSEMSGYECLEVLLYSRGVQPRYKRNLLATIISILGLKNTIFRKLKHFTKCDIKRFDLAMALVGNVDVLVIDDPTLRVDATTRKVIWNVINYAKSLGKNVIISTDSLMEAELLADEIIFLLEGNIYGLSTPLEIRVHHSKGFFIETKLVKSGLTLSEVEEK